MGHDLIPFGEDASISLASIHGIHGFDGMVTIEYGDGYSLSFEGSHADVIATINSWCAKRGG